MLFINSTDTKMINEWVTLIKDSPFEPCWSNYLQNQSDQNLFKLIKILQEILDKNVVISTKLETLITQRLNSELSTFQNSSLLVLLRQNISKFSYQAELNRLLATRQRLICEVGQNVLFTQPSLFSSFFWKNDTATKDQKDRPPSSGNKPKMNESKNNDDSGFPIVTAAKVITQTSLVFGGMTCLNLRFKKAKSHNERFSILALQAGLMGFALWNIRKESHAVYESRRNEYIYLQEQISQLRSKLASLVQRIFLQTNLLPDFQSAQESDNVTSLQSHTP